MLAYVVLYVEAERQNKMSTTYEPVGGNTYPVREKLAALGGKWDPAIKAWRIPTERVTEAKVIVASAGPKQPFSGARSSGQRRSTGCGGRYECYECEECGDMVTPGTRCWETGLQH